MLHIRRGRQSSFYLPKIIPAIATVVFLLSLFANAWTLSARAIAPGIVTTKNTNDATTADIPTASAGVKTTDTALPTSTVSAAQQIPAVDIPTCSTDRPYLAPAIVDLSVAHDGLTAVVSEPYTYVVSARTLAGLRSGIMNCTIRSQVAGSYHAVTARQIAWSYGFLQSGSQCRIVNVRVGLHITQLLPEFVPKAGTPQSVIDAWNTYHTNLIAHENGHVDVAKRYANELVDKLNALGTMDCGPIQTLAKSTIDSELKALNATDTDYDTVTSHGASQGAVL